MARPGHRVFRVFSVQLVLLVLSGLLDRKVLRELLVQRDLRVSSARPVLPVQRVLLVSPVRPALPVPRV